MESTGETEDRGAKEQLTMFNEWGDERGRPQLVNGEETVTNRQSTGTDKSRSF